MLGYYYFYKKIRNIGLEVTTKKINNSKPLDFGIIFNNSIALFKKVWVQGFVTLLLTFTLMLPFYILMYIPIIAAEVTSPEMFEQEELNATVTVMVLIIPIVFVGMIAVSLALNASFLRICKLKDLGEIGSDDYFYFFKKKYIPKLIELVLLVIGIFILGMLTCGIGIFYFIVPISLIPSFLAFNEDLSSMEIVKASFILGNKNWLVIFCLLLVMGVLGQLGIIACGIGVLFTVMLGEISVYYMCKNSIGFVEEIHQIGE